MINIFSFADGPVRTNTYVISSDNSSAVVIDPSDYQTVCDILNENNLKLDAILLTHGHFDHIWALCELTDEFHVPVYIHSNDIPMLTDTSINMARPFGFDVPGKFRYTSPVLLFGGEILNFGGMKIKVIHTPGHSKGSVCYCIDDTMFSGDTLFKLSVGRTDGYGGSFDELIASLDKINSSSVDKKIYPGHGEPTTLKFERRYNNYLNLYSDNLP